MPRTMEKRFEGQIAVVTGASAGIGRALVRALAHEGAHLGLLARGVDGLEGAAEEVRAAGGKAVVIPTDVSDHDQVERAAARVEEELGPIDLWINNAMVSVFSPISQLKPEELRRVTDVTYHGYVWGTMAALRRMQARDRGTIVQVNSALAYRGIPLQAAYCAAKHAVQGFCDSLWSELLHDGSHVKLRAVNLPAVNTPQFDWSKSHMPRKAQPVGTIFQPELIADAILWAALHEQRELNVAWPATQGVVANAFVPGLADAYLARTAYEGQLTDEPEDPDRPSNLWEPLPGDHGAHGRFDSRAKNRSAWLWASKNRAWLVPAAALALTAYIGLSKRESLGKSRRS
jgi:short-subunit dehydrogenase